MKQSEPTFAALGNKVSMPTEVDRKVLEAIPNRWPTSNYEVNIICDEYTSLCPVTNQPDFAKIYITFVPDQWLIESKSLKLYLGGFRSVGMFAEFIVNLICDDLAKTLDPHSIEVRGEFSSRGGIKIIPVARWSKQQEAKKL